MLQSPREPVHTTQHPREILSMRLASLRIRHDESLTDVKFDDIQSLTILLGGNGVGKSTIADGDRSLRSGSHPRGTDHNRRRSAAGGGMRRLLPIEEGQADIKAVLRWLDRVLKAHQPDEATVLPAQRRGEFPTVSFRFENFFGAALREHAAIHPMGDGFRWRRTRDAIASRPNRRQGFLSRRSRIGSQRQAMADPTPAA